MGAGTCAGAGDTTTHTTGSIDDQTHMCAITIKTALCENSDVDIKEDIKDDIAFNDQGLGDFDNNNDWVATGVASS